jgi:hypothetical protein
MYCKEQPINVLQRTIFQGVEGSGCGSRRLHAQVRRFLSEQNAATEVLVKRPSYSGACRNLSSSAPDRLRC